MTNVNGTRLLKAAGLVAPLMRPSECLADDPGLSLRDLLLALSVAPGTYVCLCVLELCTMGSLETLCSKDMFGPYARLGPSQAERLLVGLARDVAQALAYLHSNGLTHGDVKPANVLLQPEESCHATPPQQPSSRDSARPPGRGGRTSGRDSAASERASRGRPVVAKLADWGLARVTAGSGSLGAGSSVQGQVGTIPFAAPERFDGNSSPPVDIYSFGILLWQMASGCRPYEGLQIAQVMLGVCCRGLRPEWPEGRHPLLAPLYAKCVAHEPLDRPTAEQLVAELASLERQLRACAREAGMTGRSAQPACVV